MTQDVGSGTMGVYKCGKWDFQDAVSPPPPYFNVIHVDLHVQGNVGSGTMGVYKCGKWDFQDAVSPPPPPYFNVIHVDLHVQGN